MVKKIFGNKAGAFYFDLFIAGFIALIFLNSFNLSQRAVRLPFLIGSATLLFIIIDIISMALNERRKDASLSGRNVSLKLPVKKIFFTICFMVLTVILWETAGFIISSIAVTVGFGFFLGAKNRKALIVSAILLTLGLYWIFGVFLGVPLPGGLLAGLF